jgi:taurine dioxygenase
MQYTLNPMTAHQTGAEILGLDLKAPMSHDLRSALHAEFAKYHVLAFRDQKLAAGDFASAGKIFGDLMPQHHADKRSNEHPDVFEIRNEQIGPGQYRVPGENFHTDHSNHPCPPKATALHPLSLPSSGGDTQFLDMHNAYDDLSEAMKRRIRGLKAVHVFHSKYSPRKVRALSSTSAPVPPSTHPLVRLHPENGRKALYLNPLRMESIVGMPDDEAVALINELMAHATQSQYEYRHQWKYGDMVIWDNRSLMHQANGDYDMTQTRHLYRIIIAGEPVLEAA